MLEGFRPFPINEMPIIGIMEAKNKKKSKKDRIEKTPPPGKRGHKEHWLLGQRRSGRRARRN